MLQEFYMGFFRCVTRVLKGSLRGERGCYIGMAGMLLACLTPCILWHIFSSFCWHLLTYVHFCLYLRPFGYFCILCMPFFNCFFFSPPPNYFICLHSLHISTYCCKYFILFLGFWIPSHTKGYFRKLYFTFVYFEYFCTLIFFI